MKLNELFRLVFVMAVLMTAGFLLTPTYAQAGVVQPGESISAELYETGEATLVSGGTYTTGTIHPKNGWKINATGATIVCNGPLLINDLTDVNYNSFNGFTINGGTWITNLSGGIQNSLIKFTHAQNLTFTNMTIKACNIEKHSIELVACKNVLIKDCNISAIGTPKSSSVEEAIQIDVATPQTAPYIKEFTSDKKYFNGAGCMNITIDKCTVKGGRAVCANFLNSGSSSDKKYQKAKNHHSNIKVQNCKLTGLTSEGLALFNTMNATVKNNTIKSMSKRTSDSHSVGCHFALFYPSTANQTKKSKITVSGNKIYGGRQGLNFDSHGKGKYGTVTVKNNKLFCKKGANNALHDSGVKKMKESGNKLKKW